ncbi:MAG TPA: energy-coupling factor ABC transporter ATP-binding protein [Chloroflexi bacterium]|nr:energy-coupling factor ABC transporter ATP-binding protein [Chloroflexota bacterium]
MIHLDHLTYTYPGSSEPALSNVTLDIAEGEFVLVVGPSGAGKSTLLRCINGLAPHFTGGTVRGRISVAGHDSVVEGPQSLSRIVGFVFQDPEAQFVLDRVEDEIAFALENGAVPPAEMRVRVEEVLHLLDLAPLRDRPLETLSGGEKQRVAIAAALAFRPRVLVLDEPTSQLDPQSAEDVLNALTRLNTDLGLTIVLAEHRLERVLPHADRLVYLSGEISGEDGGVLSGPPRQVLRQIDLTPPLVTLGKALGWEPLPLTVKEGRAFARRVEPGAAEQSLCRSRLGDGADPLLCVERLSFAYNGASTLSDVSLTVRAGELVALMGRNGSGKTTLLKCIVGLLRPCQGEVTLAGKPLIGQETARICRQVGYLPQEPDDLLFADTVAEELSVTLRYHGLEDQPPLPPTQLLERLGLEGVMAVYPRDLSVGQRQRVALGAVTVTHPRLLVLDEPTRGLDYHAKQALVRLLREWQAEGAGVLLVTHDVELAAQAADRVVILSQGEVIAKDAPEVLTVSPLFAPQVARLFPGQEWLVVEDALSALGKAIPDDENIEVRARLSRHQGIGCPGSAADSSSRRIIADRSTSAAQDPNPPGA